MLDGIFKSFLEDGLRRAMEIASESDILEVIPHPSYSPSLLYLLVFNDVAYLRDSGDNNINVSRGIVCVEIRFPLDYLRSTDSNLYLKTATILDPSSLLHPDPYLFHPNYDPVSGCICLGADFLPGTPLNNLIFHIYDIISYSNYSTDERNGLNAVACRYLRDHPEVISNLRIMPLRRRRLAAKVSFKEVANH